MLSQPVETTGSGGQKSTRKMTFLSAMALKRQDRFLVLPLPSRGHLLATSLLVELETVTLPAYAPATSVVVGISGAKQNAAAALVVDGELRAFCEQERVTRVRRAGLADASLPGEALDTVLGCAGGLARSAILRYVTAETGIQLPDSLRRQTLDHHQAHAATAFFLSPFETATVFVCDRHSAAQMSAWLGTADGLREVKCLASGQGFASLYSECSELLGLPPGNEHQLEALARLNGATTIDGLEDLIGYRDGQIMVAPDWKARAVQWLSDLGGDPMKMRAHFAAAFQRHLGNLLLSLLTDLRDRTGAAQLALGGGLFYNTWFTTLARQSRIFDDVFVAPNPGNAGIAAGAALSAADLRRCGPRRSVSPFLGPDYFAENINRKLAN